MDRHATPSLGSTQSAIERQPATRNTYDAIVVGLGAMGSATAYQLARRGKRVLGLERYTPAHNRGSSHGQSRIIRMAYFEEPAYVPLLLRAYELWDQIEREAGASLLTITGGLMMGPAGSPVVAGSLRSAQEHGLPYEVLDASEVRRRFPVLHPQPGTIAVYEHQAGVLRPEAAVRAYLDRAMHHGAALHFEEPVITWEADPTGSRVRVTTGRATYEAERLVLAPGPWAPQVLQDLRLPLAVERVVQFWFEPIGGAEPFLPDRLPIYIWQTPDGPVIYGFPALDGPKGTVKAAFHHSGTLATADSVDRTVHTEEVARIRAALAERIPALAGACRETATCMYTNTPDEHFVIAHHPYHPQVAIAAGFSGHGFKFAGVVGEILADLSTEGTTRHPITLFRPDRFPGLAL